MNVRTERTFNKASFISFSFLGGGRPTKDLFMNSYTANWIPVIIPFYMYKVNIHFNSLGGKARYNSISKISITKSISKSISISILISIYITLAH